MKHILPFIFALLFTSSLVAQTQVRVYTTMGDFLLEMSDSLTPITSGNFIDLADSGYYDGVIFHRVIDNFMIQGGDPTGTGSGGPGYSIPDEFDSTGTLSNIQKSISMANAGPNTGGSQFFINLVNNTYLDYDKAPFTSAHPVFGMVIENFDVVQDIGATPVNGQNRPLTDVIMDSVRVLKADPVDTNTNDTTPPASIQQIQAQNLKTKVFPNPVGYESVVTIDSPQSQEAIIQIIDQSGRIVMQQQRQLRKGMNRFTDIDLSNESLDAGFYSLSIEGKVSKTQVSFIVVN